MFDNLYTFYDPGILCFFTEFKKTGYIFTLHYLFRECYLLTLGRHQRWIRLLSKIQHSVQKPFCILVLE